MDALFGFLMVLGLAVVLFLVCRVIVLWYWRVSEAIDLLAAIDVKLARIAAAAENTPSGVRS
jgi:hypothetical protein